MTAILPCELPKGALLARYRDKGGFTDCYRVEVPMEIDLARFIAAFYTTWLFKIERAILAKVLRRPSTDSQARQLAGGTRTQFAAWDVEARQEHQILLCDMHGRTRSWLMVVADPDQGAVPMTRLYFGSAVVALRSDGSMGFAFHALLGFHRLYSRALLRAAIQRLGDDEQIGQT